MGRQAEHVYTDQPTIDRFNTMVEQLPNGARVRLALVDGEFCEGVVAMRPTVQQFYDGQGTEGINGVVRLERLGTSPWQRSVWFDQIDRIEQLDSNAQLQA